MDFEQFKQKLIDRRAALEAVSDQGDAAAATVELDQTRVGRLSRMDAIQAQAMAKATAGRRNHELVRIASTLERIEAGNFGDCDECGQAIPLARLEIDPTLRLCVACAEKLEARE